MKKNIGKISGILLILVLVLIGVLCFGYLKKATFKSENPVVTLEVKDYGTIKIELYPDKAPNTVNNFIALAKSGYYDGKSFYSINESYVQAGDGVGTPTLSSVNPKIQKGSDKDKEYAIKGEMYYNGNTNNDLPMEKGYVAMLTTQYSMDSATSEFFIMTDKYTDYNGYYAVFGKVVEGMDVVEKISKVELKTEKDEESGEEKDTTEPAEEITITKATVDEKKGKYGVPETVEPFNYNQWLSDYLGYDVTSAQ